MSQEVRVYPYPPALDDLALERSGLIEASAGTGKTYLLEHLFIHLLLRTNATADRILVVTFTERATAELRVRLAARIEEVLRATGGSGPGWQLDATARAKLEAAHAAAESTPISTIHGFCQRILRDQPFLTRRLLAGGASDGAQLFSSSFRDVLRRQLAQEPAYAPYLEAYLAKGLQTGGLEKAARKARSMGVPLAHSFSAQRLVDAARVFREAAAATCLRVGAKTKLGKPSINAIESRLALLDELVEQALVEGDLERRGAMFLAGLSPDLVNFFQFASGGEDEGKAAFFDADLSADLRVQLGQRATRELLEAAPPLLSVLVERALPFVDAHLDGRKLAEGCLDFDDLIRFVERALEEPSGAPLIEHLRTRFRFALVDEFQDTDPRQWRIFERVFFRSGASNPLFVVGDPKQAIYGFRSADVHTYLEAKKTLLAAEGSRLDLVANFRSSPKLIEALNLVFDQRAESPFFAVSPHAPAILYDPPATPGRPESEHAEPPLTLLRLDATKNETARLSEIRCALQIAIAQDLRRALARDPELLTPGRGVFILTRTTAEMRDIGSALAAAEIPYRFHREERLLSGDEAKDVIAILRAIAAPHDPAARLAAWLTPFFGLELGELPAAAAQDDFHPLVSALARWARLAADRAFGRLFAVLLDETGLARRLIAEGTPDGLRRLAGFRHLFDLLLRVQARGHADLETLLSRFAALEARQVEPDDAEDDIYPVASEQGGVEVMTMHRAKGLEADRVYLYGAFTPVPVYSTEAVTYLDPQTGTRVLGFGKPPWRDDRAALKAERASDEQRLMYVALTRARRALVLPHFPALPTTDEQLIPEEPKDIFSRLSGGYRHVNRRLDALASDPRFGSLVRFEPVPFPLGADVLRSHDPVPVTAPASLRFEALQREPAFDPHERTAEAARLGARGLAVASYTRLQGLRETQALAEKSRADEHEAPEAPETEAPETEGDHQGVGVGETLSADAAPVASSSPPSSPPSSPVTAANPNEVLLPGGAASGVLLHDLLEKLPLQDLPAWQDFKDDPEVRRLVDRELERHGRPAQEREPALRLAHTALTHAWPIGTPPLANLGLASRVVREMEFLYPVGRPAGGPPVMVKGFVDVLFEHQGRLYLADWKSDRLPSYDPPALRAHVADHYGLQARLYTRALLRMLRVNDEETYRARFGGMLFVFLRGLTREGAAGEAMAEVHPTWTELRDETSDLALAVL